MLALVAAFLAGRASNDDKAACPAVDRRTAVLTDRLEALSGVPALEEGTSAGGELYAALAAQRATTRERVEVTQRRFAIAEELAVLAEQEPECFDPELRASIEVGYRRWRDGRDALP